MPQTDTSLAAALVLALTIGPLAPGCSAQAQGSDTVVLRLKGSTFQIEGELRSFEAGKYVVNSSKIGVLTLDASRFDCIGARCNTAAAAAPVTAPTVAPAAVDPTSRPSTPQPIRVVLPPITGTTLLADLVKGWRTTEGGRIVREIGSAAGEFKLLALDRSGAETSRFEAKRTSADAAFAALAAGSAEIVITDRRISDQEAQALAPTAGNMRSPARETVIGLDAFAVVVAAENPVIALPADTMARIFSGQITNWSDLGQPARPIKVFTTPSTTGPGSPFDDQIMRQNNRAIATTANQLPSSEAVAEAVAQSPDAIGVAAYADMRNAKPVNFEQSCGLITQARSFTVRTEEYPLSRRIYLYTARQPASPDLQRFLAFVRSPQAEAIVADNMLVNQTLEPLEFGEHSGRLTYAVAKTPRNLDGLMLQLLNDINGAQRISTTIRFDFSAATFDSKSQDDLVRLATLLRQPDYAGRTIMLLGFSDPTGTAAKNASLATRRADQVRTALLALTAGQIPPQSIVTRGYGPLAPVACDGAPRAFSLNRRVEVWVKDAPRR